MTRIDFSKKQTLWVDKFHTGKVDKKVAKKNKSVTSSLVDPDSKNNEKFSSL